MSEFSKFAVSDDSPMYSATGQLLGHTVPRGDTVIQIVGSMETNGYLHVAHGSWCGWVQTRHLKLPLQPAKVEGVESSPKPAASLLPPKVLTGSSNFSVDAGMFQTLLDYMQRRDERYDELDLRREAARNKFREETLGMITPILPLLVLQLSKVFSPSDKKLPGDDHLELALLVKRLAISLGTERFGQVVKLLMPEELALLVEIIRLLERVPAPPSSTSGAHYSEPPTPREPPTPQEPPTAQEPPAPPAPPSAKPRTSKARRSKK